MVGVCDIFAMVSFPFFAFLIDLYYLGWGLLFLFLTGPTDCDSIPFCTGVCLSSLDPVGFWTGIENSKLELKCNALFDV